MARANRKSAWDVVVVGGLNQDYMIRGAKLPRPGETIDGETFFEGAGGKGANQAVAAARLGARVALIGCVGRDARGEALIEALRFEGVETKFVARHTRAGTGVAVIMVDAEGEKQILTAPGANLELSAAHVREALTKLRGIGVVLMQFEIAWPAVFAAAEFGRRCGAKIILDPAPAKPLPRRSGFLKQIDIIRPNAGEAEALTGVRVSDRTSARRAAKKLLECGIQAVAVQAGSGGNLLVWREGEEFFPKIRVKSVDATGAGDAFAGAMAVSIAEGASLVEAARLGNAAAALTTTKMGAQTALPRRGDVLKLLKKHS